MKRPPTAAGKAVRASPLRYPGGKLLLAPYIAGVIEENFLTGCNFYEPFAGGAAVSLELLRLGYIDNATLFERDPLIYAFWWSVKNNLQELVTLIEKTPISLTSWKRLSPLRHFDSPTEGSNSLLELGFAGLFFNRTNFSGVIGAGPIGGMSQSSSYKIDCRFNKKAVVSSLVALEPLFKRISIEFGDSLSWLETQAPLLPPESTFIYIDPPYHGQGKRLYRHHFSDMHHTQLSIQLTGARYPWLLSYDDSSLIRDLYKGSKLQPIYFDHRVKTSRLAQEIVISNLEIPPPVYEGFAISDLHRPNSIDVHSKKLVKQ